MVVPEGDGEDVVVGWEVGGVVEQGGGVVVGQGVDEVLTALLHTVQAARAEEAEKELEAASEPVLAP